MSQEAGSGHISIFPVFTGFRSKTTKETQSAGTAGGRAFERGFQASARDLGSQPLKRLQSDVAKASRTLARHRLAEADAAGKVRVAEIAAAEAREKYGDESSQAAAASERLASAQRKLEAAQERTKTASDGLAEAQKDLKDATGEAGDSSTQASGKYARGWQGLRQRLGRILPSAVRDSTRGADSAAAAGGERAGRSFSDRFRGIIDIALGNVLARVMTGVTSKLTGIIRQGFSGGWDRLLNLQDARIKLNTLGLDADAAMGVVNSAVDGTKFAISEAADMAGNLGLTLGEASIASGEMERWIKLTGDAAQFSNREFTDMQRIMEKVVADGKVSGDTFQELPLAAAALADNLGISQEEVRKLASQGGISAEEFAEALESKIGGAAQNAGGSFRSMLANVRTAINAGAANLLDPIMDGAMPVMESLLDVVKTLRDGLKPVGEAFGEWLQPRAEAFAETLGNVPALLEGVGPLIGQVREFLGPLMEGMGSSLSPLLGQVVGLVQALSPLGIILKALEPVLPTLVTMFSQFGSVLAGALSTALVALTPVISQLSEMLAGAIVQILPMIMAAIAMFLPALMQLVPVIMQVVTALLPVAMQIISALLPLVMELVSGVLPLVAEAITTIVGALGPLIEFLAAILIPAIQFLLPLVIAVVEGIIGNVIGLVEGIVKVVTGVVDLVGALFRGDWAAAWDALKQIVSGAVQAVWNLIQLWVVGRLFGAIRGVLASIRGVWQGAWSGISSFFGNMWTGMINGLSGWISRLLTMVRGIKDKVLGAFKGAGKWLWDTGKNIVQGLMDGVGNLAGKIGSFFLSKVPGWIVGPFKKALGIASPSRVFAKEVGEEIPAGVGVGVLRNINAAVGPAADMARRMVDAASTTQSPAQLADLAAGVAGVTGSRAGATVTLQNEFNQVDPVELLALLWARIRAAIRQAGGDDIGDYPGI